MFRFDNDDVALLAILGDPFLDDTVSMDPFAVRIIQQVQQVKNFGNKKFRDIGDTFYGYPLTLLVLLHLC